MYARYFDCRELKAGMRVARSVVHRDVVLAEAGTVLTDSLIHLFMFMGIRRVAARPPAAGERGEGRAVVAR